MPAEIHTSQRRPREELKPQGRIKIWSFDAKRHSRGFQPLTCKSNNNSSWLVLAFVITFSWKTKGHHEQIVTCPHKDYVNVILMSVRELKGPHQRGDAGAAWYVCPKWHNCKEKEHLQSWKQARFAVRKPRIQNDVQTRSLPMLCHHDTTFTPKCGPTMGSKSTHDLSWAKKTIMIRSCSKTGQQKFMCRTMPKQWTTSQSCGYLSLSPSQWTSFDTRVPSWHLRKQPIGAPAVAIKGHEL